MTPLDKPADFSRHIVARLEDFGRLDAAINQILEDEIFDELSKHDEWWHSAHEPEADKLDELRLKLVQIHERLGGLWEIIHRFDE